MAASSKSEVIDVMNSGLVFERGGRLKSARALVGMSRKQFEQMTGISENSLRMWECPKEGATGLTERSAVRVCSAFAEIGMECTFEWLMFGVGQSPRNYKLLEEHVLVPIQKSVLIPEVEWGPMEIISQEIQFFNQMNPNSLVIQIKDDAMSPLLQRSDYVGAADMTQDAYSLLGKVCVVELIDGSKFCRRLERVGSDKDHFTLLSLNTDSTEMPALYNVKIQRAGKLSWIRKSS